jgi:hypothetical protein
LLAGDLAVMTVWSAIGSSDLNAPNDPNVQASAILSINP